MKLAHGTLRPATVIEVLDDGQIKVDAPGLFDAQDKDGCPPVYPFYGQHANSFSSVAVNDEVWVMSFADNPLQLHWIRKDDFGAVNGDLMEGETVDIFMNRKTGKGNAILMYSDEVGWVMRLNGATIGITQSGDIVLDPGELGGHLIMPNANISTGARPVALGDTMKDICMSISSYMKSTAKVLKANTMTMAASDPLEALASEIDKKLTEIESTTLKVD